MKNTLSCLESAYGIVEKYTLLQNVLLGLSLAAPIGPVNVEIIQRGLKTGFKQAFLTGIGAMSADATYLTLIYFGLISFLDDLWITICLGIGGSLILFYLGITGMKEFFQNSRAEKDKPRRFFKNPYGAGYILAFFSPLTIAWWTGVFGALLAGQTGANHFSAFISCFSILLGCFLWVLFISAALQWGKKMITDKFVRSVSLVAGIFLIGFGIYFLWRTFGLII